MSTKNLHWMNIQGYFDFAYAYDNVIKNAKDGDTFVELGTWLGKSTCYMGHAIKESGKAIKFYACDMFETPKQEDGSFLIDKPQVTGESLYAEFLKNIELQDIVNIVTPIKSNSLDFAAEFKSGSIDFLFIDDCHFEEHVYKELIAWNPKMKRGGLMAGHDIAHYEVKNALERFKRLTPNWEYTADYNCWYSIIK